MASANVELVRSIYASWERGDFSSTEWAHRDIELVRPDGLTPGSQTKLADIGAGWRDFLSTWEDFRAEADESRELDGERVLVLAHFSGRGKTSGLELGRMPSNEASLFHVRDGKVTRLVLYANREHALADLGLAP